MDCNQAYYLALLQGLTEFLPISSSAHLILMPVLFGWQDQGLAFDIAVHVGTLLAVVLYFQKDLRLMLVQWLTSLTGKGVSPAARAAWYVIVGTVPVCIVGLLAKGVVETELRSPLVIAGATFFFALVLWLAQKISSEKRVQSSMKWQDALIIGLFQALALIPGTSRAGITITGGLFLGFHRKDAACFSFLLSIPVIALAGFLKTFDLLEAPGHVDWMPMLMGILVSGVTAYACIELFLKLLDRIGMLPFVVYRIVLGIVLFALFIE